MVCARIEGVALCVFDRTFFTGLDTVHAVDAFAVIDSVVLHVDA